MKRTIALLGTMLAVCALAGAQENSGNRVVVPAHPGGRPRTVEATLLHGSITVKAGAGGDVVAELVDAPQRRESRVPPGMHRIDSPFREGLQAEETGDTIHISVGPMAAGQGSLVITVPANSSLKLHGLHGDIIVTGVRGEIDAASTHGDINLTSVSGTVLANTVHGSIRATMDQVDQGKPLSFSTLSGSIDVTFPADLRATLKLKADRGDIWTDFDVKLTGGGAFTQPSGRVSGLNRVMMDRALRGTINGGGVEASFYTVNGRITIHKK